MTRVSELIHSSSWLSPEHRGPVTWGGQGRGGAAGPRGGRVVEGGQVGDGRGPGHCGNFYSERMKLPRKASWSNLSLVASYAINYFCIISYFISANFVLKPAPLLCVWGRVWVNCSLLARWEHLSAAPGPLLTTESIGPASGIICRSRSYVPAWRGATLNKQSTGLRRHCPGLSLVSMAWCWPLIGWCELTPSVSRRRRQKYEEQSSLWRNSWEDFFRGKYFKRRSRQSVSLNDIILWILMSGMNVWSWIYELFLRNRFPCWCFYNFFDANLIYLQ